MPGAPRFLTAGNGASRKIVDATIQAIESAERRSLAEIPESAIGDYRQMLSDLPFENVQANLANSNVSGAELLKQLGA